MKKWMAMILVGVMALVMMTGCGAGKDSQTAASSQTPTQSSAEAATEPAQSSTEATTEPAQSSVEAPVAESALTVMETVWNGYQGDKFTCYGGPITNPVEDRPGSLAADDEDMYLYTLLLTTELCDSVTEGASLVHYMNANTFTGAVLKVDTTDMEQYVATLKDTIMNAQFMCGFPEKLTVVTYGDYVIYAFGETSLIDAFEKSASDNLEGAKVSVSEPM